MRVSTSADWYYAVLYATSVSTSVWLGQRLAYMHVAKVDVPTVDALLVAPSGEARACRYQSLGRLGNARGWASPRVRH